MKLKATKVMADFLKKNINLSCVDGIKLVKISTNEFKRYVDFDTYPHEDNDYDYNTGRFKAIKVTYTPNCYAYPKYLTTRDLVRCYKNTDGTIESFIDEIIAEIEI